MHELILGGAKSGKSRAAESRAADWLSGASTAASTPRTVTGAMTGATNRFASTATTLTCPDNPAITGAVTR